MAGYNGAPMRRVSAYDRALELAKTPEAKLTISRLGAELGLPASASEWVILTLYAEAHGIFGSADSDRQDLIARLERIEEQQKGQTRVLESLTRRNSTQTTDPIIAESTRYVMAFCLALLIYIAIAVIGAGRQPMLPFVGWIGAFTIG